MRLAALALVMVCVAQACAAGSRRMARADLFFGAGHAPSRAWYRFLKQVVTPRFPEGLTTFDGMGQWRAPRGVQVSEPTHILVLFYRADTTSDARLDAIRTSYKRRFHQRSVLRADSVACVGF